MNVYDILQVLEYDKVILRYDKGDYDLKVLDKNNRWYDIDYFKRYGDFFKVDYIVACRSNCFKIYVKVGG